MRLKASVLPAMALAISLSVPGSYVSADMIPDKDATFTLMDQNAPSMFGSVQIDTTMKERHKEEKAKLKRQEKRKEKLAKDKKIIWATDSLNIRKRPSTEGKTIGTLVAYEPVKQLEVIDGEWSRIRYNEEDAYISKKYTTEKHPSYREYDVPEERGRGLAKSYESWHAITDTSSPQYALLHSDDTSTGKYGIKTYKGRLCIAMGSYYGTEIGTMYDITLDNGTVLYCILADQKSDKDTNPSGQYHECDGSIIEFVVDTSSMPTDSYSRYREFDARIQSIKKVTD